MDIKRHYFYGLDRIIYLYECAFNHINTEGEKVRKECKNGCLTTYITGEIDHHSAQVARIEIENELERTGSKILQMDFSGVSFMDSAGIGLILGRYRKMQETGGELRIVGASPRIEKMMKMAGLSTLNVIKKKVD